MSSSFFCATGGTMHFDSPSYVERRADADLYNTLVKGEFCYVLTSRQMGKSSLMARAAHKLKQSGHLVAVLDLTSIGQNVTADQWYNGLLNRLGRQLGLEDEVELFWTRVSHLGPCRRFFAALSDVILPAAFGKVEAASADQASRAKLVVFIDEVDAVKSLPFSTDELFAAIRSCYNERVANADLNRLTFCLLGVAMPYELIDSQNDTPFNIGAPIVLEDFTDQEALRLAEGLNAGGAGGALMRSILRWTSGHPFLTQRLCRAIAEGRDHESAAGREIEIVDRHCQALFLSPRSRETDDNLLFVREWILRTKKDLNRLLEIYAQTLEGETVQDDLDDANINRLRLSGIVKRLGGRLEVRNRIYAQVFNLSWIRSVQPLAELEKEDGARIRLKESCAIGRMNVNEIVLDNDKVSRKHALIEKDANDDFWLADLGSRNGTFLNGTRIGKSTRLRDGDTISIGPFKLRFHQLHARSQDEDSICATRNNTLFVEPGLK